MEMSPVKAFRIALGVVSVSLSGLAWGQCAPPGHRKVVERFASVKYIEKVHGPAGIELILEENDARLTATLRDYEGDRRPRETRLDGRLRACAVMLSGRNSRGSVEISGRLTVPAFEGSIRRQLGKQWYQEEVFLKRELSETPGVVTAARGTTPLQLK